MKESSLQVDNETVKFYHANNGKQPLFFAHGMALTPLFYLGTLKELSQEFDIHAPLMYGATYFQTQRKTINQLTELSLAFKEKVAQDADIVSHSLGTAVSLQMLKYLPEKTKLVGFSPILQGEKSMRSLTKSMLSQTNQEPSCLSKELIDEIKNYKVSNARANQGTLFALCREISNYQESPKLNNTIKLVLSGAGEYFPITNENTQHLHNQMSNLELTTIPNAIHNWIAYHPKEASELVLDFLK